MKVRCITEVEYKFINIYSYLLFGHYLLVKYALSNVASFD